MFDQPTLDKENTPPTHVPQIKKGARLNNLSTQQQQSRWTTKSWKEAMDPMEKGEISLKVTSKHWHIPFTTFSNYLNERTRSRNKDYEVCSLRKRMQQWWLGHRYITMWIVHYLAPYLLP
jgi:hypothetical protein